MAIEVDVAREFSRRVPKRRLKQVALNALASEGAGRPGLTIAVRGDAAVRALNRRHLRIDAPTDVLSFSSDESGYLGDIVISYETARRNARLFNWPIRDELALLVVHGLLHLLGYEDSSPSARRRMWQRQEMILGSGVSDALSSRPRDQSRSK